MKESECFYVGKIVSKYSFKGEVLVKLDSDDPEIYEDLESVFVSLRGSLVPFFLERSTLHKSDLLRVRFEGVTSEADADALMGSKLFLPLSLLPPLSGNKFYYHEVLGFQIIDKIHGPVGQITTINDHTAQALMVVEHPSGKELLLPVTDEVIVLVDRTQKNIQVNAPEGLIELYLEG